MSAGLAIQEARLSAQAPGTVRHQHSTAIEEKHHGPHQSSLGLGLLWPALFCVRNNFKSVFKMHRVKVKPFATPNELMAFKYLHYFEGNAVFPDEFAFPGFRPEIERSANGVLGSGVASRSRPPARARSPLFIVLRRTNSPPVHRSWRATSVTAVAAKCRRIRAQ
jgi:hypothetical protein